MAITSGSWGTQPTFFDPNNKDSWYGNSAWQNEINNSNQEGYYANWLGNQGLLGMDMNSDYARSLYNKFYQGYNAQRLQNSSVTWQDYLNQFTGKLQGIMNSTSTPEERGINQKQFGGLGDVRWLPRS